MRHNLRSNVLDRKSFLKLLGFAAAYMAFHNFKKLNSVNKKIIYRIVITPTGGKTIVDYFKDMPKWANIQTFEAIQRKFMSTGQLKNVHFNEKSIPLSYEYEFASHADMKAFNDELSVQKAVNHSLMASLGYDAIETYG